MKEHIFTEPEGGDQSQGWALLSVCWAFVLTATITTIMRTWVRARLTRNLGWDDYTIIAALVCTVWRDHRYTTLTRSPQITTLMGAALITTEIITGGLGRHSYYLTASQKRIFASVGWADWIQTFITLALMKISICLFLLRLVDGKRYVYALYGLMAFMVLFTSVCVFLFIGVCRPLKAYWDINVPGSHCLTDLQVENVVIAQGGTYILSRPTITPNTDEP